MHDRTKTKLILKDLIHMEVMFAASGAAFGLLCNMLRADILSVGVISIAFFPLSASITYYSPRLIIEEESKQTLKLRSKILTVTTTLTHIGTWATFYLLNPVPAFFASTVPLVSLLLLTRFMINYPIQNKNLSHNFNLYFAITHEDKASFPVNTNSPSNVPQLNI